MIRNDTNKQAKIIIVRRLMTRIQSFWINYNTYKNYKKPAWWSSAFLCYSFLILVLVLRNSSFASNRIITQHFTAFGEICKRIALQDINCSNAMQCEPFLSLQDPITDELFCIVISKKIWDAFRAIFALLRSTAHCSYT